MPLSMVHEGGPVFRLNVSGTVRRADFEHWRGALAQETPAHGAVRLLVVLDRFKGWSDEDRWGGLEIQDSGSDPIERIAIVGDARWWDEVRMFVAAGLRKAPVEFFVRGAIGFAREWLNGSR
jgi:SpoIIAA-like